MSPSDEIGGASCPLEYPLLEGSRTDRGLDEGSVEEEEGWERRAASGVIDRRDEEATGDGPGLAELGASAASG